MSNFWKHTYILESIYLESFITYFSLYIMLSMVVYNKMLIDNQAQYKAMTEEKWRSWTNSAKVFLQVFVSHCLSRNISLLHSFDVDDHVTNQVRAG